MALSDLTDGRLLTRLLGICLACSCLVVLFGAVGGVSGAGASETTTPAETQEGHIVELFPNPTTPQNHGEYALVNLTVSGNWTLTDGHRTAKLLTDETGTVAVTRHPEKTAVHTDVRAVEATGHLRFAVSGDTLELRRDGVVVDTVSYEQAPESHRWRYDREPHWQPDGFNQRPPKTVTSKSVESFVLPDSPDAPLDAITGAEDRLYLAAYTLTDERVADELRAANARGADVVVLIEGGPVGGMSKQQAAILDDLASDGIDVRVMTGDQTRFRYQHAKYAVADDRVVVLTENWKPSGTGGADSRGWGITIDSPRTADELNAIFEHDTTWDDTLRWQDARERISTYTQESATGSYPTRHPSVTATADALTVLTAPDNAATELAALIAETDDTLVIKQPQLSDPDFPLLGAAVRAAERGVEVRILLDSTWYVESDNRELAAALNQQAERADMPLEVRLADSDDRFGKIHSKGIVADDTAVIGSVNWNNNSVENNRELAIMVEDETVADYYRSVFDADWSDDTGETDGIPTGIVVVGLGVISAATLLAKRRLEFTAER